MALCTCNAQTLVDSLEAENNKLQKFIEENSKKDEAKLSALEQERYVLQRKQALHDQLVTHYQEDVEALQAEKVLFEGRLQEGHKKEIEEYQQRIESLKNDLERARSEAGEVSGLRGAVSTMRKEYEQLREQLMQQKECSYMESVGSADGVDQDLLAELKQYSSTLKAEKDKLEDKHERVVEEVRQKGVTLGDLNEELHQLTLQNNALSTEKERLQGDLRVMRARLEASQAKPDHHRGNSLFSEVEDRRVVVEKGMIDLRLENDSLKKRLQLSQELLNDAKLQSVSFGEGKLLGACRRRVDEVQVDVVRMERRVMEDALLRNHLEDEQNMLLKRLQEETDPQHNYGVLYSFSNDKIGELSKELGMLRVDHWKEQQRSRQLRREVFAKEQELLKVKSSEEKLKLRKLDSGVGKENQLTR